MDTDDTQKSQGYKIEKIMMTQNTNVYGDMLTTSSDGFGCDISSQRFDELDREFIAHCFLYGKAGVTGVDLGCGYGVPSLYAAAAGLDMNLYDIDDLHARIETAVFDFKKHGPFGHISFYCSDLTKPYADLFPNIINICYSQRFVHYLTFQQARNLLYIISERMPSGSKLFISASGLHSELGTNYPDQEKPIEQRHCNLHPNVAIKHKINEKLALYTEEDLKYLVTPLGYKAASNGVTASQFGNIKGIFDKI